MVIAKDQKYKAPYIEGLSDKVAEARRGNKSVPFMKFLRAFELNEAALTWVSNLDGIWQRQTEASEEVKKVILAAPNSSDFVDENAKPRTQEILANVKTLVMNDDKRDGAVKLLIGDWLRFMSNKPTVPMPTRTL